MFFHRGPFKRELAWDIHNQLLPASFFSQVSLTLRCASFRRYVHSSSVYSLCVTHSARLFQYPTPIVPSSFQNISSDGSQDFALPLFSKKSTVIIFNRSESLLYGLKVRASFFLLARLVKEEDYVCQRELKGPCLSSENSWMPGRVSPRPRKGRKSSVLSWNPQPCNSCTAAVQLHLKCVEKDLQIWQEMHDV